MNHASNPAKKYIVTRLSPDGVISAALLNREARQMGEPEYQVIYTSPRELPEQLKKIGTASEVVLADMILYDSRQFDIAKQVQRIVEDTAYTIDTIKHMRDQQTRFRIFSPYLHARDIARVTGMNGSFDRTRSSAESIAATMKYPSSPIYDAIASIANGMRTPLVEELTAPGNPSRHTVRIGSHNITSAFFCGGMDVKKELYSAALYNHENVLGPKTREAAIAGAAQQTEYLKRLRILGMQKLEHILSTDMTGINPHHRVAVVLGATQQGLKINNPKNDKVVVFQYYHNNNPEITAFFVRSFNPAIDAAVLVSNAVREFGGLGGGSITTGSGIIGTKELNGVKKHMNQQIESSPSVAEYQSAQRADKPLTHPVPLK